MKGQSADKARLEQQAKAVTLSRAFEEIDEYAIILLDRKGYVENWNRGAQRIKGYEPTEIIGQHFSVFYSPEDQTNKIPDKMLETAVRKGKALAEGWRYRKDKTRFWGNISITAIHNDHGSVIGFIKVTKDLTQAREQEELLRKSEERYHRMISEVQDYAIILLDAQGFIQNWNKGAEKIKGYRTDEIVGKHFSIFYVENDQADGLPQQLLHKAREEGRVQHESWRKRKDGTLFWGFVTITCLQGDHGEIVGFSKVTRDLTEKKLAEQKITEYIQTLENKNRELEQFNYIASHDLQEPLRTISSFAELLQIKETGLDEKSQKYLQIIANASSRMRDLIVSLLQYSRIGYNEPVKAINLNELVAQIASDLSASLEYSRVHLVYHSLPTIMGYPVELRLMLQNLISNGIKFHRADNDRKVWVTAEQKADHWQFCVRDNGIGIPADQQERVFEIFHRLHLRSEYVGSGIGLAHCKKIAALHQGTIWMESKEGEGTSCYFTIPFSLQ